MLECFSSSILFSDSSAFTRDYVMCMFGIDYSTEIQNKTQISFPYESNTGKNMLHKVRENNRLYFIFAVSSLVLGAGACPSPIPTSQKLCFALIPLVFFNKSKA